MVPPLSQKWLFFTNLCQGLSSKVGFFLNFSQFYKLAFLTKCWLFQTRNPPLSLLLAFWLLHFQNFVPIANKSDHLADYLDLTFIIDTGGKLSIRLYDKRDDFDFHIVNFPYLSSNIPSGPSYGVYISQLIRYA